jgi:hypothetical protein
MDSGSGNLDVALTLIGTHQLIEKQLIFWPVTTPV